jgi:hypothetical protein
VKQCGVYRVLGKRDFRGHTPGTEFPALLPPQQERRAVMRGSIEKIGTVVPAPGPFAFPEGWLEPVTDNQGGE